MINEEARSGNRPIAWGGLRSQQLGDRAFSVNNRERRCSRRVHLYLAAALMVVLPSPLSGQFGETDAFNWFTGCAPIRITGKHFDSRLLEGAQVAEDFTFDVPADVEHIVRTKLDEQGLATEDVFAWGLSGIDDATILPRMEISVTTQLSGRRDVSISFQKWLRDPISDKEHYATTWHVDVSRPTRENELAVIQNWIGTFVDLYIEFNAEACNESAGAGRPRAQ